MSIKWEIYTSKNNLYKIRVSQEDWGSSEIRAAWAALIGASPGPDALGNSPEYLDHLMEIGCRSEFHLVTVRDAPGTIVGIVPIRVARLDLQFNISSHVLWRSKAHSIHILGSLPLLPADAILHDSLFETILGSFPDCGSIVMPSVPIESFLWRYLGESPSIRAGYLKHLPQGVSGCHTINLPPTVGAYHSKFGPKKRYNLKRQERILRERCGDTLELVRVESPDEVGLLTRIINDRRGHSLSTLRSRSLIPPIVGREADDLAARKLLLVYLLMRAGRPCAALMGLQSRGIYHLNAIARDRSLDSFSPGSTALHMAIEDLIGNTPIRRIDFGYGEPAPPYSSINVIEPRACVVLFRKTTSNHLLRLAHATFRSIVVLIRASLRRLSRRSKVGA